ncbi:MAG: UDP-N-acetylmuramoyl-L-alanine--D-glutamate ligase [bacterium]|nr:UDP-N-acetylmuramoyl-L-alanine--D-glutamate ligase [bacterium]MDZ4296218.1 UDP-N-acetylmuramoyl-L-alanine--D-glutamate ligase [Patescibacteria group bacterium]
MKTSGFRNKKVLIMGLGLHGGGVGAAAFFARRGAQVRVTDLKSRRALAPSLEKLKGLPLRYHLGGHRESDFRWADIVIQNPGVRPDSPYIKIARDSGAVIDTDIGIFFALCPTSEIVGVTGTKGKSTTATLIAEILRAGIPSRRTLLAGNIRNSVLAELDRIKKDDIVVLELSSWQLEGLARHRVSPHVAVITSIFPDHLNRYVSMDDYVAAKKLIFAFQSEDDHLFLPRSLTALAKGAPGCVHRAASAAGAKVSLPFPLRTPHYRIAVVLAAAVGNFYGVRQGIIGRVFKRFKGLEGRLEVVARHKGVTYINDTTATSPGAAVAALKCFARRTTVLIAGGQDKALDVHEFVTELNRRAKAAVLLPGSATDKIRGAGITVPYECVATMREAVAHARQKAKRGDTVLLSPGAASFDSFAHEFDRGEQFRREVLSYK